MTAPAEGSAAPDLDALMTHREALELRDAAYWQGHRDGAEEVRQVVRNALGVTE